MKVFVVTPTYNEKENLPILAEKVFALKIPNLEMIVVDDDSPDGTGQLAEELAKKWPIKVIHRQGKMGLGTAYVAAFKEILSVIASGAKSPFGGSPAGRQSYNNANVRSPRPDGARDDNFVIQMDADLSHDPGVIPKMLRAVGHSERSEESPGDPSSTPQDDKENTPRDDKPCDVVLGSRYIKGGGTENWDFFRKLVSKFGNVYARIILGLPYHDLTGGYKCWQAKVLKNMDLDSLSSVGYNFQIETTYKAHKAGYKICEVPITFTERKTGKSKFNLGIIIESFWKVIILRFQRNK